MKRIFCILSVLTITSSVWAEDEIPTVYESSMASAAYVQGAYDALSSAKQEKLTSTNVTASGSGAVVTGVTANNGVVTVAKGEVTIPVGNATNPTDHATIWVQ